MTSTTPPAQPDRSTLAKRHHSGSGWFGTIAVLSLINIGVIFANFDFNFPVGLGVSSFASAFLTLKIEDGAMFIRIIGVILMIISLAIIGCLWFCKIQSRKNKTWAYILGMSVYSFDAIIILLFKDWISFGFHVWGLWSIWVGYSACKIILKLDEEELVNPEKLIQEVLPSNS